MFRSFPYLSTVVAAGFQFAAAGFDVWLANERGNRYGRRHVTLDSEKDADKFYAFTFIEHGTYDLAAQIDYITKHTNHSKVRTATLT